jgi:hypothetical protein
MIGEIPGDTLSGGIQTDNADFTFGQIQTCHTRAKKQKMLNPLRNTAKERHPEVLESN